MIAFSSLKVGESDRRLLAFKSTSIYPYYVRIQVMLKAVKPMLYKHLGELWQNPCSH